jgi:hypothetical protein
MNARPMTKRARLAVLLLLAAVVLTVGILGAPGAASAAPTSLTASSLKSTVTWGGFTILTGTLMDTTTPLSPIALGGQLVRVEWSLTDLPPWTLLATVTTDSAQYYTGQYAVVVYPKTPTWYRFNYLGSIGYDAALSNDLLIHVRPALGVPKVPSSAKVNKLFTISGTLKPRFPAGQKTVKLTAYRHKGKKWVSYKTYRAVNANSGSYTRYSLTLKISQTGRYRFTARTAATATFSPATSRTSTTLRIK